ncbi:MAG: M23 family metallopeptidase [Pseudomonadota bacterium]
MNIIIFRGSGQKPLKLNIGRRQVAWAATTAGVTLAMAAVLAFTVGRAFSTTDAAALAELDQFRSNIVASQADLTDFKDRHQSELSALALRLGELEARSVRMESLGARLTQVAQLEDGEFNFLDTPPLGGPEQAPVPADLGRLNLAHEIDAFAERFEQQSRQLSVLEQLIAGRELDKTLTPKGKPIRDGWQSSNFGKRVDPFTGEIAFHPGVDFAGPLDAEILAVADGVVTWSGERYQYGNTVELDHGNGYVTRYAHNKENRVTVGQRVAAGDVPGIMGSTGRATGSHVHFEVFLDGRRINPADVIYGMK